MTESVFMKLPGEGEIELIERTKVRIECRNCGDPATQRHTYLIGNNPRSAPSSSAYGKDDVSWCSDHEEFTCSTCARPSLGGYSWNSTFNVGQRFAHMFLIWREKKITKV